MRVGEAAGGCVGSWTVERNGGWGRDAAGEIARREHGATVKWLVTAGPVAAMRSS